MTTTQPDVEKRKERVLKDLSESSKILSTNVRTTALGIVAVVWTLALSPQQNVDERLLLVAVWLAILTLFLDLLQYVAAYMSSRSVLAGLEKGGTRGYNEEDWRYILRGLSFNFKVGTCLTAVVVLLVALAPVLLR